MIFLRLGDTHLALPASYRSKFRAASGGASDDARRLPRGVHARRAAVVATLVLLACGEGAGDGRAGGESAPEQHATPDSAQPAPATPRGSGAAGPDGESGRDPAGGAPFGDAPAVRTRAGAPPALLTAVRTAAHEGFDRIVLEFADDVPGFRVEYVEGSAFHCGSGEPARVDGEHLLRLRIEPANAHTDAGEPTVRERDRRPRLPVLGALALTCDFEAQVEWVAGLRSRGGFRVLELSGPPRLVVDVRE